jgi:excisionase family DNA binding protein
LILDISLTHPYSSVWILPLFGKSEPEGVLTVVTKELMLVSEASTATRLSKAMIYKLLRIGRLRRVFLPGCRKVLIDAADVQRYIDEGIAAGTDVMNAVG